MRLRTRRRGQAAVEGLLSIPVLMVIFMIGFELWGITWDAQYVNIRSRYDVLSQEDQALQTGQNICQSKSVSASITFPASQLPLIGSMFGDPQSDVPITNTAQIVCNIPSP